MNLTDDNTVIAPIVHKVPEMTEEVYEDAEEEALETGRVVIINVVDETEESDE